jgi:hypothetical protein
MTRFLSTHKLLKAKKICSEQEFAQKICSQQKFAHRICWQHRKTAQDEKPCRLGWINTMAKCLASSQSEHGWRAPSTVSVETAGTCWAEPSCHKLGSLKYFVACVYSVPDHMVTSSVIAFPTGSYSRGTWYYR